MALRRTMTSRRKNTIVEDGDRVREIMRIRLAQPLRIGSPAGTWVGRLDSKSKLRIVWKLMFGPKGRQHEVACTVSRKSKKREVFLDGELVHSGALGLLESVGGVAADTTLFEHRWEVEGRLFCVSERVFVREGSQLPLTDTEDPAAVAAAREAARFEFAIDGKLFHTHNNVDSLSSSEKEAMEENLHKAIAISKDGMQPNPPLLSASHSRASMTNTGDLSPEMDLHEVACHPTPLVSSKCPPSPDDHGVSKPALTALPDGNDAARLSNAQRRHLSFVSGKSRTGVITDNGLAARVECSLGPGILGGKVSLKNDSTGTRVEVENATREARECGVAKGDVLLSLNGRMLPPKLDAVELMSLLRANPRYMLSEVVACLWRRRLQDADGGTYVTARLVGNGPLTIELSRLDSRASEQASLPTQVMPSDDRSPQLGVLAKDRSLMDHELRPSTPDVVVRLEGYYVVVRTSIHGRDACLRRGDVVVGLDHEPAPRYATATSVAQLAGDWAAAGKLYTNVWRLSDPLAASTLADAAHHAARTVLIASPGEVATAAADSASGIWGTATTAVTVTGDGGRGELALVPHERRKVKPGDSKQVCLDRTTTTETDDDSLASSDEESILRSNVNGTEAGSHGITRASNASSGWLDVSAGRQLTSASVGGHVQSQQPSFSIAPVMPAAKASIADDRNFAVFKRLLQSGATLDEIVAEMRSAGVPKETTQRIIESLRTLVAERAAKVQKSEDQQISSSALGGKPSVDARGAMLAMIAKRQGAFKESNAQVPAAAIGNPTATCSPAAATIPLDEKINSTLARYRKMVKLGVPAASVRQRMRLDQIETNAVRLFAAENGLEDDEADDDNISSTAEKKKLPGKRAKLHWDAMTLDDRALAVSVWAADAFGAGDVEADAAGQRPGVSDLSGRSEGLLNDDDLERLATLFSDADNPPKLHKRTDDGRRTGSENAPPTVNGRPVMSARLLDPQRSQNISITIAPLVRVYDGVEALACAIARMDAPRTSLEQLETLLAAMPTDSEKIMVNSHVSAAATCADAHELATLDAAILKDGRFASHAKRANIYSTRANQGSSSTRMDTKQPALLPTVTVIDMLMRDAIIERECVRDAGSESDSSDWMQRIRRTFAADNLAPAERFAHAVLRVESALLALRGKRGVNCKMHVNKSSHAKLAQRLEALVTVISAKPATEALAEKADTYTNAARLLVASRDLAKLLKHVLAAGNAVNAGSAKAGASAVRISSLLQVARTKGADGKTSLLDGVVGLLLDRAARRQQQQSNSNPRMLSHPVQYSAGMLVNATSDPRLSDDSSPRRRTSPVWLDGTQKDDIFLKDDLLDFPENDNLLTSLDAVRGADERALAQEATKFAENLSVVSSEIKLALLEFGPDADDEEDPRTSPARQSRSRNIVQNCSTSESGLVIRLDASLASNLFPRSSSRQHRLTERDRLIQLETDAVLRTEALRKDHVEPLQAAVSELRTYFACDANEPLDAIFATLRDFLRAFCDSRDVQRRQRRAEKREAERRAAKAAVIRSSLSAGYSGKKQLTFHEGRPHDRDLERVTTSNAASKSPRPPKTIPRLPDTKKEAKPPSHPPPTGAVDTMVARARRRRTAVADEEDDAEWTDD